MANINIDIASEFTGAKAFKKAETATDKLNKGAKNLAKTLGLAFGAQQILAYGKASIKAAAADEKAQKQLALALKNVGLGRDAATSEAYIQKLQSEFGIIDDLLRPAYQTLAVATRDTAEAQRLLQISLDISASTGKDLGSVTAALSKAYLGNNTALSKLGVGISKADLKAKSFKDITDQLAVTFAGAATESAASFQGSMDKLNVASNNVKETIGIGIIDSLKLLAGDKGIETATAKMEKFGIATNETLIGLSALIAKIQNNKIGAAILGTFGDVLSNLQPFAGFRGMGQAENAKKLDKFSTGLAHLAELEANSKAATLKSSKAITAEANKQLQAARLKAAIDKANLALGKGTDVFDMEKIQLQAAEINQAQQLGKVTSQAQLLQITNDLARLETKKAILALEAAIATGDEKAITAATAKLNANLGILGSLTGQQLKLGEIESILKDIVPKDLINIANLDEAIAKLKMLSTGATTSTGATGFTPTSASVAAVIAARSGYDISGATDPRVAYGGQRIDSAGNYNSYNPEMAYAMSSAGRAAAGGGGGTVNVTVQAGIGDPNAIAETVTKVIQDAIDRGTVRNLAVQ
jgi:hypothetical protein